LAGAVVIRRAGRGDVSQLTAFATAAYAPFIERIGREPAPMLADFAGHVGRGEAFVLEDGGELVAYIVTYAKDSDQFVENVAVRPSRQGQGHGRRLMDFAETRARDAKLTRMVLYTNVKMTENLSLYPRLGYVETRRVTEDGFERVYFEKVLVREDAGSSGVDE